MSANNIAPFSQVGQQMGRGEALETKQRPVRTPQSLSWCRDTQAVRPSRAVFSSLNGKMPHSDVIEKRWDD